MPDDYYVSRYSGEEIDDLLGKANAAVRYDAAQSLTPTQQHTAQKNIGTTYPCNPNLLDNWCFLPGCVVNQRGQTSYTGAVHGIDMASGITAASSIQLTTDGLKIQSVGGGGSMRIAVGDASALAGREVTLSVLGLQTNGAYLTPLINGQYTNTNLLIPASVAVSSITFTLPSPLTSLSIVVADWDTAKTGYSILKAAKLELGDTQTLAHKEGDTWVLNEIPDYGEQLRRCQRYFVRVSNAYASGHVAAANIAYVDLITPVPMRTNPAVTVDGYGQVSAGGSIQTPSQISLARLVQNHVYLGCALSTAWDVGHAVCLHDAVIDLSADL